MSERRLSTATDDTARAFRGFAVRAAAVSVLAALAITALALGPAGLAGVGRAAAATAGAAHWPRFALLAHGPLALHVHLGGVGAALVIGAILLAGVKGTTLHRALGWAWVAAMAAAAVSSLFIHTIGPGRFSWLHLFSGWTLIALPVGVMAARRGQARRHGRTMAGLYLGGLVVAGAAAFLPGRLMWRLVFG